MDAFLSPAAKPSQATANTKDTAGATPSLKPPLQAQNAVAATPAVKPPAPPKATSEKASAAITTASGKTEAPCYGFFATGVCPRGGTQVSSRVCAARARSESSEHIYISKTDQSLPVNY